MRNQEVVVASVLAVLVLAKVHKVLSLTNLGGRITVDTARIQRVYDFNYLRSSVGRDIEERRKAASRAYDCLMPVWKVPLRVQTNLVEPVLCLRLFEQL